MKPFVLAVAAALAFGASPAQAITCARPGTVNVHKVPDGYVFYVSKTYGDAAFMIRGADFASDPSAPSGSPQFTVDGVHYQFLSVPKAALESKAAKVNNDAAILARHARREHQFAVNAGSQFTVFDDLGNRARLAEGNNPAFLFKMWTLKNPKQPDGASQFMLTTVVGDEVAVLSATVPSKDHESRALAVFERYSASYQFLQSQKDCPPAPAPKPATP